MLKGRGPGPVVPSEEVIEVDVAHDLVVQVLRGRDPGLQNTKIRIFKNIILIRIFHNTWELQEFFPRGIFKVFFRYF